MQRIVINVIRTKEGEIFIDYPIQMDPNDIAELLNEGVQIAYRAAAKKEARIQEGQLSKLIDVMERQIKPDRN